MLPRGRSHTKPRSLLKSQIPIRTWAERDDAVPGSWRSTRSRPGNKNDWAHVDEKNWSRVRELVGYLRYDTPGELEPLNQILELDRIFTNYLISQQKLVSKTWRGAKVIKKHDAARTPHRCAITILPCGRCP